LKDTPYSLIGRIKIANISVLTKVTYRFNAIFIKITMALFTETGKNTKLHMERKCNEVRGLTIPDTQTYCKAIITKINMGLVYRR
jgi:hypothetical protein